MSPDGTGLRHKHLACSRDDIRELIRPVIKRHDMATEPDLPTPLYQRFLIQITDKFKLGGCFHPLKHQWFSGAT